MIHACDRFFFSDLTIEFKHYSNSAFLFFFGMGGGGVYLALHVTVVANCMLQQA